MVLTCGGVFESSCFKFSQDGQLSCQPSCIAVTHLEVFNEENGVRDYGRLTNQLSISHKPFQKIAFFGSELCFAESGQIGMECSSGRVWMRRVCI